MNGCVLPCGTVVARVLGGVHRIRKPNNEQKVSKQSKGGSNTDASLPGQAVQKDLRHPAHLGNLPRAQGYVALDLPWR